MLLNQEKSADTEPAAPAMKKNADGTYTVIAGDTMSIIAADFNISMSNIQSWNKIGDADTIRIGEVLVLKAPAAPQASSVKKITVKTADTATALAVKFGSTIEEIKVWNYLDNKYTIYGGESLEYLK